MKTYSKVLTLVFFLISVILMISPNIIAYSCNKRIICDKPNWQWQHSLCSDGEGGALVSWADNRSGLGYDIYAQKIDINGLFAWNTEGIAVCTEMADQTSTKICSDGEGGAIVIWSDYRNGSDLYAQRIDTTGNLLWNASGKFVSSAGYCHQICSDSQGGAVFTWKESYNLYTQRINSNGTVMWDSNGVVICNATKKQDELQFFCDDDGTSFFTWTDYRVDDDTMMLTGTDIYAQKVDIDGNVQWQLNGTPICAREGIQWLPQICTDGTDGAIINWVDADTFQCFAQRINSTGDGQWGANGTVLVSSIDWFVYQTMISDNEGGVIIAIRGVFSGIYALRINSNAEMVFFEHTYPTEERHSVGGVDMCSDGKGGTFIVWTIPIPPIGSGPYTHDISAQRIDSNGTNFWSKSGKTICNTPSDQHLGNICNNGIGKVIISWEDWYPGSYPIEDIDIYFTILKLIKGNTAISFGIFYILFLCLTTSGLVITVKRYRH